MYKHFFFQKHARIRNLIPFSISVSIVRCQKIINSKNHMRYIFLWYILLLLLSHPANARQTLAYNNTANYEAEKNEHRTFKRRGKCVRFINMRKKCTMRKIAHHVLEKSPYCCMRCSRVRAVPLFMIYNLFLLCAPWLRVKLLCCCYIRSALRIFARILFLCVRYFFFYFLFMCMESLLHTHTRVYSYI